MTSSEVSSAGESVAAAVSMRPQGSFGRYRVISTINSGGMGIVFRARRDDGGEPVALKTVRVVEPTSMLALRREISALRRMDHRGIVRILESGSFDGVPWYAMELLAGVTLSEQNDEIWGDFKRNHTETVTPRPSEVASLQQLLSRSGHDRRFAARALERAPSHFLRPAAADKLFEVLRLYLRICEPLSYLHGLGIVHCDLNPRNVFVRPDGAPVLVDFGLWAQAGGSIGRESLEVANRGFGSINYMAPEQILGRSVDARSDLYALGCMLYETVTGAPPFAATEKAETLSAHLEQRPIAPSQLVSGLPVALDELILTLLAKAPEHRLGHAEDVGAILGSLVGDSRPQERVHPSVGYLYRPRIAGRHEIVAELMASWDAAVTGHGRIILIGGESGIGKTFVVNEVVQQIQDRPPEASGRKARVVTGDCWPPPQDRRQSGPTGGPFHPLRPLLEAISDYCAARGKEVFDAILGDRARSLGVFDVGIEQLAIAHQTPLDTALPSSAARDRILTAMRETLRSFAAAGPLLLVLDDLQWGDDLTLAFLRSLSSDFFTGIQLLVLGTFRAEESLELQQLCEHESVQVSRLSRLDEKSVAHVIGDMLAIPEPPAELVAFVERESGGNPFLVGEYLRLLVSERLLSRRAGRWEVHAQGVPAALQRELPAPSAVHELVSRRLSRLSGTTLRFVECAALLGRSFDPVIVQEVLGRDALEAEDAMVEAVLGCVVDPDGRERYAFTHEKIREAAYQRTSDAERVDLHARAARTIEARFRDSAEFASHYGELAEHFSRGGERRTALGYMERAGVEALRRSANADAITYLQQTLECATQLGERDQFQRARWLRQIGDALQGLGNLTDSTDYLCRAASALGLPLPETTGQYAKGLFRRVIRQMGHRLAPRVFLRRRRDDTEFLLEGARVYDRLQQVFYYRGEALPILYAALTTLNLSELAAPSPELVNAYANAHAVSGIMPAVSLSAAYRQRAEIATRQVSDPAAHTYLALLAGGQYVGRGDWDLAKDTYDEGVALAKQIGFRRRWEELIGATAVMEYLRGCFTASMQHASSQYESALRGDAQTQCWGLLSRAQVFNAWDRADLALKECSKAEALLSGLGRPERIWAYGVTALAALRCERWELAGEKAQRGIHEVLAAPPVAFYCIEAHGAVVEVCLTLWSRSLEREVNSRFSSRQAHALVRSLGALARVFPAARPRRFLYEGFYHQINRKPHDALERYRRSQLAARELAMPHDEARATLAVERLERAIGQGLAPARAEELARPPASEIQS